ncbi:hypothetical protein H0H93_012744 [Arthromyces matolae]|nr:hypothetical protein H0H93_012744 [Arthromyces matolae]
MDNIDWLKIEDGNAEGIIAAVVAGSTLDKSIRKFCANVTLPFIQFLTMQKPRATILRAVILDLPELPDRKGNFLKVLWQEFRDGMNIASKRLCIIFLANLAISAGQMQEAMELGTIARGLYQKHGIENAPLESRYMRAIEEGLGRTQLDIGKIDDAESTVKRALSTSLTIRLKSDISIELGLTLAYLAILLLKGRDDEARLLLAKAKKDIKKLGPIVKAEPMYAGLWYMQLCFEDKEDIEEVRNACEDVINTDKISYSEDFKTSITIMAIEVALRQNDMERAKQNVKRAVELTSKMKPKPLSVFASFTVLVTNDFKEARSLINRAIADASVHGIALLSMSCLYIAAGIEMHAGEYTAARDLYQKIIEDGVVLSEMPWRARSTRALGEIALLDGDADGARAKFEEVASLCKTMGVPPKNLYRDSLFKSLDKDKFIGWQQFLDTLSTEA